MTNPRSVLIACEARGINRRRLAEALARGEIIVERGPIAPESIAPESIAITWPGDAALVDCAILNSDKPKEPWRRGRPLR